MLFPSDSGTSVPLVSLYSCLPGVECSYADMVTDDQVCVLHFYSGYTSGTDPYDYADVEEPYDCLAQKGYYQEKIKIL